jgi:hypothetical protein
MSAYAACGPGVSQDQFNALVNATANLESAFANWKANLTAKQDAAVNFVTGLQTANQNIANFENATQIRLKALRNTSKEIQEYETTVGRMLSAAVNKTSVALSDAFRLLGSQSTQLQGIANATRDNFQILLADLAADYATLTQNLQSFSDNIANDRFEEFSQLRRTADAVIDLITTQQRLYAEEDMLHAQNRNLQRAIAAYSSTPNSRGRRLFPFTEDPGTPGLGTENLDPSISSALISDEVYRFVTPTSPPIGYVTRVRFKCDSRYMVSAAPMGPSWTQLMSYLGADGCDPTWVDKSKPCKCVMVVSEQKCNLNAAAGLVDRFTTTTSSTLLDSSVGCTTAVLVGALDGTAVYSMQQYGNLLAQMSQRGVYPGSGYQYFSLLPKFARVIAYDSAVSDSLNMIRLMSPDADHPGDNLVYWSLNTQPLSYQVVYDNLDLYKDLLFGKLPNYATQSRVYFERYAAGTTGSCTLFTLAFYSNEFLKVGTLIPGEITTNVAITIDGNAAIQSDVVLSNPYDFLLPVANQGYVYDPTSFTQKTWDIPDDNLIISSYPKSRERTVLYPIVADPSLFARDQWQFSNGFEFDHTKAGDIASAYETNLDVHGLCTTPSLGGFSDPCLRRTHFQHALSGPQLLLADKDASYLFSVAVPSGRAYQLLDVNGCPIVKRLVQSVNQLNLAITNTAAGTSQFQLQQIGACPKTDVITVGGRATYNYPAYVCGQATVTPDVIIVSYLANGTFTPCPSTVNLTEITANDTSLAATLDYTLQTNVFSTSLIDSQIVQTGLDMQEIISQMALASLKGPTTDWNFVVPPETLKSYTDLLNSVVQTGIDAVDRANATRGDAAADLTLLSGAQLVKLHLLEERNAAARSAQETALQAVIQSNEQLVGEFSVLRVFSNLETASLRVVGRAWNAWTNAVTDAIGAQLSSGSSSNWGVSITDHRCSGIACAFVSWGAFVNAAGELPADAVVAVVHGAESLAKDGKDLINDATTGPIKQLLAVIIPIVLVIGIGCCCIQCFPFLRSCPCPCRFQKGPSVRSGVSPAVRDMQDRIEKLRKRMRQ